MSTGSNFEMERKPDAGRKRFRRLLSTALAGGATVLAAASAQAAITCERNITANVVAFDKPLMYNRLGASNVNGQMFALERDVILSKTVGAFAANTPITKTTLTPGQLAGNVDLRPDKRHRPLVLRVRIGDCLTVKLKNLLTPAANPFNVPKTLASGQQFNVFIDDQVASRQVGFHAAGMQLVDTIASDSSFVGNNASSLVASGGSASYKVYAEKEGVFLVKSDGATFGADANQGQSSIGLFGQVIVEPKGAEIFRGQTHEEELRLATTGTTAAGQPVINYNATYPTNARQPTVWDQEGKGGLPVLNTMKCASATSCEIVHSEINAVVAYKDGTGKLGNFPATTYPLESKGKRNPTLPNRLEPFRDFAQVWHDEPATAQAFPAFYNKQTNPVFGYILEGVKDGFMINYGSGGIGSEIIANRLGVGPMHDCLDCAYEEFFLTSFTVGDPALTVDVPANLGLEQCYVDPNTQALVNCPANAMGKIKANYVIGAEDPSNVHHSYIGDFVKFRNTHTGKEQHVFHLHNHQWLYNPNDDNSNYLDAQGIGPGAGYTYEINNGGSGNRNKSAGDAIFHCHFYPHFAQGMWYHWRNNDTLQTGTVAAATPVDKKTGKPTFHSARWALANTTPAGGARAYPDGEIVAGTPIPAVVPLPGKPMPPMPAQVTVAVKKDPLGNPIGSVAKVVDRTKNPGFPFWIAGMEDLIGQRPTTPPLDMANANDVAAAKMANPTLFAELNPAQAGGFDGGLPRHGLQGYADGGLSAHDVPSPIDFSKVIEKAKPVYYPEIGTDLEQVAMAFHAQRCVPTYKPDGTVAACDASNKGGFILNGSKPVIGAVYHNPCIDDTGATLKAGTVGQFFSGETLAGMSTRGSSVFNSDTPRIYKGTNMQYDAVINKVGYHYPQQRIVALWEDVVPVISKQKPAEPLVMRLNTFDCAVFHHSNLVPENYEIDDYQVRTPTDIIGQHIHLPKWDLTTTDGAANGWNYEDGTLSPGTVRERIHAIRKFNNCVGIDSGDPRDGTGACPVAQDHPYWAGQAAQLGPRFVEEWKGARTTIQRWFSDPVVNTDGADRGLGIVFTHDHYGPSTHQQIGLYSTVLIEPAGSQWKHNETGQQLGCNSPGDTNCRADGGPTSWQAAILPPSTAPGGSTVKSETVGAHREFYFEYSDFQHAYEAGVYVGAGQDGLPLEGTGPHLPPVAANAGNPDFTGDTAEAFRFSINPPNREQIAPVFPELYAELAGGLNPRCPSRPCPQAIDVQDPGLLAVNYRNEPIALRIYDPAKSGPDGKPGMQADGAPGDLAFALQSRTDRAIARMNVQPAAGSAINGTIFPPPINAGGVGAGDPFTPMIRTYVGDTVRVKMQAGGHEEEHNATIHGVKWLQAGSGFGKAPNSGWRNAQAGGISEQFTLTVPVVPSGLNTGATDYAYSMDAGHDGWWSGMWGIMRAYKGAQANLYQLPGTTLPLQVANATSFNGLCPIGAPVRSYDITAVLANKVLPNALGVTIPTPATTTAGSVERLVATMHAGGPLDANGGTLVYNHRNTLVSGLGTDPVTGVAGTVTHNGALHDPTAILYVRTSDLDASGKLIDGAPVEPVVIRANAGECVQVTLRNALPPQLAPDLATYSTIQGVVKRDRFHPEGSTTFQTNLFRPSNQVGLNPQLVAFDVERDTGLIVGANAGGQAEVAGPGQSVTYRWYAGDVSYDRVTRNLVATSVEFGGSNLTPADKVKQGAKSLVGAMVIEPAGSTWTENTQVLDHQDGLATRLTRAQATVNANDPLSGLPTTFRDFSLVLTKGLTQYYRDGTPVEHMNGEGAGLPEDSQEASGMALDYGVEPMWFRFGLLPQAPFGNVAGGYGSVANAFAAYSNSITGNQDPATPVFQATAGQPFRTHITNPYGTTRGSTFTLHGHVWQRDPYVCPGESRNTLTGACNMNGVASRALGNNPMGFAQGGQESWTPGGHFDIVVNAAGGGNAVKGDYLMRDHGAFGNASGVWGLLRVQ